MSDFEEKMKIAIEQALNEGKSKFIIYPYGTQGRIFKKILNKEYNIREIAVIDKNVKSEDIAIIELNQVKLPKYKGSYVFVVSDHTEIWLELRKNLLKYVSCDHIIDVFPNIELNMVNNILNGERVNVLFNPMLNCQEQDIDSVGGNTGNLVFAESIKENCTFDLESQFPGVANEWIELGNKNVFSIFSASNFLNPCATWIEELIPFFEKMKMNITFVGLGAQANLNQCPQEVVNSLSSKQIYLFKLVSERARSIGVRGEFTAACLEKMGIKNIDIIGCPSIFSNQAIYPVLKQGSLHKVLYTADKSKEKIYSLAKNVNAELIKQVYSDGEEGEPIFFDFQKWNEYIQERKYTFAFGSRFHGNVMALRNGIPTLWITHDWRTLELVRYLHLPYLDYFGDKFMNIKYADELIEFCDYGSFNQMYLQLQKKYESFIKVNLGL